MNEITRIHLGRQPFVIAVDAHKQLRDYLDAIKKAVGSSHKEVLEEVELRMAELLLERGVTGDKTILADDVAYLQQQLGKAGDFKSEEADTDTSDAKDTEPEPNDGAPRRLYRDEQEGMLAGVCSGMAAYFSIDPLIVRLSFVVLTLVWGWGVFLYIILWILVPAAKTSSERLHMRGKAVTVDNLKALVERADVQGAAERATKHIRPAVEKTFMWLSAIIGYSLVTLATIGFFVLAVGGSYVALHHNATWGGVQLMPQSANEVIFAVAASVVIVLSLVFVTMLGNAMANHKSRIPGWVVATLIGLLLVAGAIGTAVAAETIDRVRDQRHGEMFRTRPQ